MNLSISWVGGRAGVQSNVPNLAKLALGTPCTPIPHTDVEVEHPIHYY